MKKVNKEDKTPLYLQLSTIIKDMIETQELKPGSVLMSERDLCKWQNMSRMTVNKAIKNLVNEGLLERKQGKGTFVAKPKIKYPYQRLQGFTEMMTKKGLRIKNKLLSFECGIESEEIKKKLKVTDDTDLIYKIERVRFIEEEPFVYEVVYVKQSMCPDLSEVLVNNASLYQLYREHYHHEIIRAEQVIRPTLMTKQVATLLHQSKDNLALHIDRVVYTSDEAVMEYTSTIFMSDQHDYEIILHAQ